MKSGKIVRRGRITSGWSQSAARLTIAYVNEDFERVTVTAHKWDSKPVYVNAESVSRLNSSLAKRGIRAYSMRSATGRPSITRRITASLRRCQRRASQAAPVAGRNAED